MDRCSPEKVGNGNIFMSGYSPMLLDFLNSGFDGKAFLKSLVCGYAEKIGRKFET